MKNVVFFSLTILFLNSASAEIAAIAKLLDSGYTPPIFKMKSENDKNLDDASMVCLSYARLIAKNSGLSIGELSVMFDRSYPDDRYIIGTAEKLKSDSNDQHVITTFSLKCVRGQPQFFNVLLPKNDFYIFSFKFLFW